MFGCSSSCVAHPNQASLMKRPPTQYVAEAIGHSQRVVVLPAAAGRSHRNRGTWQGVQPNLADRGDFSAPSTLLASGMRPRVGFSAPMPQHCAGQRSDPSPSLPRPNGVIPVARAAASPPLEAPGVRRRSHGFTVAPHSSQSECQRTAMVARLVRPIGIAPAARTRWTLGASRAG